MIWGRALAWLVTFYAAVAYALELARVMVRWMLATLGPKITLEAARRARR